MPELAATRAAVIGCFAAPEALKSLMDLEGASAYRVAPDEVMLVGDPDSAEALMRLAIDLTTGTDADAVVLDATDGWAVWTVSGDASREAFARLSAVPLPDEGYAQGSVAHVPVRAIALPNRLHLLVPAMWREHLRERILHDCASLGVQESPEPAVWAAPPVPSPPAQNRRRGK